MITYVFILYTTTSDVQLFRKFNNECHYPFNRYLKLCITSCIEIVYDNTRNKCFGQCDSSERKKQQANTIARGNYAEGTDFSNPLPGTCSRCTGEARGVTADSTWQRALACSCPVHCQVAVFFLTADIVYSCFMV